MFHQNGRATLALVILTLAAGMAATPAWGAPSSTPPDIYVNNHRFSGPVLRSGGELVVGLDAMAALMKIILDREAGTGRVLVGGRALASVRTQKTARGDLAMVSLKELVTAAGGRVMEHPEMGMVDVITFDPTARAKEVAARKDGPPAGAGGVPRRAGVDRNREADAMVLEEIFASCMHHLHTQLGMDFKSPIVKFFVPLEEIQRKAGSRTVRGFTRYRYNPQLGGYEVQLYIPTGQKYDHATHVMAHELGHAWQFDSHVQFGTASLIEGFCEWVASDVLESMGFTEEMAAMEQNGLWEYSDGYLYIKRMVAKIGPRATLDRFRNSRWGSERE